MSGDQTADAGVASGAAVSQTAEYVQPPEGWFDFGYHIDTPDLLEFSTEVGEDGLPRWERPVAPPFRSLVHEFNERMAAIQAEYEHEEAEDLRRYSPGKADA